MLFIVQSYPAILTMLLSQKSHINPHADAAHTSRNALINSVIADRSHWRRTALTLLSADNESFITVIKQRSSFTRLHHLFHPLSDGERLSCFMQTRCYLVGHEREGRAAPSQTLSSAEPPRVSLRNYAFMYALLLTPLCVRKDSALGKM